VDQRLRQWLAGLELGTAWPSPRWLVFFVAGFVLLALCDVSPRRDPSAQRRAAAAVAWVRRVL